MYKDAKVFVFGRVRIAGEMVKVKTIAQGGVMRRQACQALCNFDME